MKKFLKSLCAIIVIIVVISLILFVIDYTRVKKDKNPIFYKGIIDYNNLEDEISRIGNMKETIKVVVVKVNSTYLLAMDENNTNELYSISFTNEGNIGFKKGQEILVYFDGIVNATYPGGINKVGKIEIIKEESNIEIPENILTYCYSSKENVKVTVNELTKSSITITIVDTNEIPYKYNNSYSLYKKVKNENYTGVGEKIGKDTENSTAGFTRNRK